MNRVLDSPILSAVEFSNGLERIKDAEIENRRLPQGVGLGCRQLHFRHSRSRSQTVRLSRTLLQDRRRNAEEQPGEQVRRPLYSFRKYDGPSGI